VAKYAFFWQLLLSTHIYSKAFNDVQGRGGDHGRGDDHGNDTDL